MSNSYSLMIHGGAGALEDLKYEASEAEFQHSIMAILAQGRQRLAAGDSAEAQVARRMTLDHERIKPAQKLGTVGAVARDLQGNLAAATSTGGLVNKRWGRVGDTPIVGAGVFADNDTCAVSATGYGEQFLRTVLAKTISDIVLYRGLDAAQAAQAGIEYLLAKVNGDGGVIVIDRSGRCGAAQSTSGLIRGWIELGGEANCQLG